MQVKTASTLLLDSAESPGCEHDVNHTTLADLVKLFDTCDVILAGKHVATLNLLARSDGHRVAKDFRDAARKYQ